MSVLLDIDHVDKYYGHNSAAVYAVQQLSMQVRRGEIVSLLGSSGCGKTSTLRMIAGFESISGGTIRLDGKPLNALPPVKRGVAMAFEGYSLYPPLSVRDNIAIALKSSRLSRPDIESRLNEVAQMLEISDLLDKFPNELSGGQQQRVSLGRALVRDASLHLLDEPMGQLEPQLRALLRGRIKHFIKSRGLSAILVTHDQAEANALSDRIAVMEGGNLVQFDTPDLLKDRPANLFTGTFIGEPPMNVFDAGVEQASGELQFRLSDDTAFRFDTAAFPDTVVDAVLKKNQVVIGVRPYALRRSPQGLQATVTANQWLGDQTHIAARLAGNLVVMVEHDRALDKPKDRIGLELQPTDLHVFDKENGKAISHGMDLAS